jgi:transcriptional regulator with XRE-family HTH domain
MLNLKLARKAKKLTQKELGDKLGINDLRISRYENGVMIPRADVLRMLAKELGVSMEFLLEKTS